MLRPATPLALLLLIAFGLLLLSVLSTPIIQAIPLGSFEGVNYGVFGFCTPQGCSGIEIGYDAASPFKDKKGAFDLPGDTRNTLSAILIVHPIAAFFTLIMFILAVVAHLHSPSHSARYLLILFVFAFVDFLVCLLAFLIDVLLFVPHMAWGSYIVLAATILVGFSGLVSCAMRRVLVSRKARKKRIAENAEMSGENYFNREAQAKAAAAVTSTLQPTMPVVSGGNGQADNLPVFASFENQKKDDQVSDERIPLTARSPTDRSPINMPSDMNSSADGSSFNAMPPRSGSAPPIQRDQYGNPIVPQDAYGVRRGPSTERMNSRGRGGTPPPRYPPGARGGGYGRGGPYGAGYGPPGGGRGGYGPPGRGGYGGPGGRGGGYGPPGRGGYGAGGMRGGRPPPGYQGASGPYDRHPSPANNAYGGSYSRRSSDTAPGYSTNPSMPSVSADSYEAYNPDRGSLPRAESPPPLPTDDARPIGRAVEMDASSGSPGAAPAGFGQFGALRDSDADIAGMVGLQQGRGPASQRHETYMSEASKYSSDEPYVPPRQGWAQGGGNSPRMPSPLNVPARPAELQGRNTPPTSRGNAYYEDVDPRFADSSAPGGAAPAIVQTHLIASNSLEDIHGGSGARSPGADSDRSNYTSISQRGVNPRWNPPPPMPGYGQQGPRRPERPDRPQQRQDMLLNSNPDFQLGSGRVGSPPRGGGGMTPGSAYPTGL